MALISIQNITLGYETRILAKNLSFDVNQGDYLCIVGENGTGKTTLMKSILGLHSITTGKITTGDGLKAGKIGYLPQQTDVQRDFPASVYEIVLSGCRAKNGLMPFYSKDNKTLAEKNMELVNISALKNRNYRELSGGQQQRVLLARALCATEIVLLLDEPVSGLDPVATSEMYEILHNLHKQGTAIIMISHDISVALEYATHILQLGSNIFYGTCEEYKNSTIGKRYIQNAQGGDIND